MDTEPRELLRTAMRVSNTLRAHGVRFALAGGCAVYAHGGPASDHDVDVFVTERDAPVARKVLVAAGMRAVDPPEDWLTKVYDGNCLVDLVFRPNGRPVTPEALDRAEVLRLGATTAPVVPATDLMVDKLLVLEAHRCDFTPLLPIARAVREQVDWAAVARRTGASPYARAFLTLLSELGVTNGRELAHAKGAPHVRSRTR
ncbi:nucleotidyltransferase family protein [Saccharomonospora glauca]|uniref:Nucleotidyltransferase family protein n=1 Tax=Saccharomonospora glauca K62 TaxID=928724 RepID=I1D1K8_9PSEU|nr:nucleotidyltransferase [Saccharomonospora glauca]EIE98832.1 hypothetical protein SacglDRAFT_01922 [Saccharomonospora glauca K62]